MKKMKTAWDTPVYEAPQAEVINVVVEQGFAGSGDGSGETENPGTGA